MYCAFLFYFVKLLCIHVINTNIHIAQCAIALQAEYKTSGINM